MRTQEIGGVHGDKDPLPPPAQVERNHLDTDAGSGSTSIVGDGPRRD